LGLIIITVGSILISTNSSDASVSVKEIASDVGGSGSITRPLLQNSAQEYYCGCTCTTSCGAICK